MKMLRNASIVVLVLFTGLTGYAVYEYGLNGIIEYQLATSAGLQVLIDLVIACGLILVWIYNNARETGRNPWPYFVITAAAGCYGPLLYFALTPAAVLEAQPK